MIKSVKYTQMTIWYFLKISTEKKCQLVICWYVDLLKISHLSIAEAAINPGDSRRWANQARGQPAILCKLFATCVRNNPASPEFLFSLLISLRLTVYNTWKCTIFVKALFTCGFHLYIKALGGGSTNNYLWLKGVVSHFHLEITLLR